MMRKKVISMLLIAAMLAMPIGCGKDGNKDKDTTAGVETTDTGDDSAETDAPPKTPVPKEDKETKESDKDTDTENETDFSDDDYEPAQVTKKEYESMSAQDLIDRIKDVKNITEDEALALYSTYAYTNYKEDFYSREENITDEAFKILKDDGCKIPYTTTIRDNMLHSESANVRAYAFSTIGGLFGTTSEEEKMAEEVLAKETEPVVLFAALRSLGGAVSNPAVAEFVLNMTEHENANVRKQAALAIGSEWAMGIDGMVDAILKLMNDENEDVRTTAYKYAGRLHDDRVIDPLEEVLKDSSLVQFHDACITSLTYMWYDYPSHRYTNERAYRITIDYLSQKPRNGDIPYWTTVGAFRSASSMGTSYEDWKKEATYFDEAEINNLMLDIVADQDADRRGREIAMKYIMERGDDASKESLKNIMENMTEDDPGHFLMSHTYEALINKE